MKKHNAATGNYAGDAGGEQGFWPSYADMMSAVALILFFVMLLTYIQNMITSQSLKGTEEELAAARAQLEQTQQEVADRQLELDIVSANLEVAQQDLDSQQITIDEQRASIAEQSESIAAQQAQIAEQQEQIDQQKELVSQQAAYLESTQSELAAVRTQMQEIAGIRLSVVNQIKTSIENSMGSGNAVTVSDSGNLVLGESILFSSGSYDLTGTSYEVLAQLGDGLYKFLSDPENAQYVDTIVIGGHCDSTGSDTTNNKLSQDRARVVLEQLLSANNGELQAYREYFSAAGYGSTRPIASNDTVEGRAQNRRIEISITLKDESVMKVLEDYLSIEVPAEG